MAERLRRAQPDSVANHVKACQSLIERSVRDWLLSLAELDVNVTPFAVVSFVETLLFSSSAARVIQTEHPACYSTAPGSSSRQRFLEDLGRMLAN